jgi:hypothetical protein
VRVHVTTEAFAVCHHCAEVRRLVRVLASGAWCSARGAGVFRPHAPQAMRTCVLGFCHGSPRHRDCRQAPEVPSVACGVVRGRRCVVFGWVQLPPCPSSSRQQDHGPLSQKRATAAPLSQKRATAADPAARTLRAGGRRRKDNVTRHDIRGGVCRGVLIDGHAHCCWRSARVG